MKVKVKMNNGGEILLRCRKEPDMAGNETLDTISRGCKIKTPIYSKVIHKIVNRFYP